MFTGLLEKMDADDAYAGHVASLTLDVDVTLVTNPFKAAEAHPDYIIESRSPKGRSIRVGSAWAMTSRAGNAYLSLVLNVPGQPPVRVNAVEDGDGRTYRIIPLSNTHAV